GKFDEARAVLTQAFARKLDTPGLHLMSYWTAAAQNDTSMLARDTSALQGTRSGQVYLARILSNAALGSGQLKSGREMFRVAAQKAQDAGFDVVGEQIRVDYINGECSYGLDADAQRDASDGIATLKDSLARLRAALVVARCGDARKARDITDAVLKAYPTDTMLNDIAAPQVFAMMDLHAGRAQAAIDDLSKGVTYGRYDMGSHLARADAYLAANQADNALQELQFPLSQKYFETNVAYREAQLLAARAYVAQGNKTRAREMYQDVLAAWKNADPGLPLVEKVKAEYAKLQ
ncbi:MAG TPA: hypothetical protein VKT29_02280, partial [Terriglobales bacterium]|nr:hypothetical protein [Terriglobales bacterium]